MCYEDIPRVRLDRVRRPAKAMWDGPPTLAEENEDSDTCLGNGMSGLNDIVLNTTLYNDLGKFQEKDKLNIDMNEFQGSTPLDQLISFVFPRLFVYFNTFVRLY